MTMTSELRRCISGGYVRLVLQAHVACIRSRVIEHV
jgi:hypothetical protein